MSEADDQARVIKWAKGQGYFARKVTSVGSRGFPDLIIGNPRTQESMFIEMKVADGRESAHQRQTQKLMLNCGMTVRTARSVEEARMLITAHLGGATYLGEFKA